MQPEAIIDINIQEKIQSKITVDYSEYEYIAKLGEYFNFDDKDPFLIQNSLVFNNSQFIYIKDPVLKETFTIEFRIELSQIYDSDITLFNYTLNNNYQLLIFFNASYQIHVQLNGLTQTFSLIPTKILHFSIGVIHKLELNFNYFQLCFIQFSDEQVISEIFPENQFSFLISQKPFQYGKGQLLIGSAFNKFNKGQFLKLYKFRLYLGYYYDDQGLIDPDCKFYLNDRCIICKKEYTLSIDNKCVKQCSTSIVLTEYMKSHNQCIRSCHTTCATCLNDSPTICLICSGNRVNPPHCNCPPKYFEDNVSPNCRKYYQEIQTQSGFIRGVCTSQSEYIINFDFPYNSVPTVEVSLQGHEFYFYLGFSPVINIQTKDITVQGFKISFLCTASAQQYYVQWISTIGRNKFNVIEQAVPQNTGNFALSVPSPQILENQLFTTIPHFRSFKIPKQGWGNGQIYINNQNNTVTTYSINCIGQVNDVGLLQSSYVSYFYRNFSQIAEIPIQNMPKSISSFNIITETDSDDSSNFNILHMQRSSKIYKLQNNYKTSRIGGHLLFTAFQCFDPTNPCDFYESYLTSCSLEFSFCQCNEEGYFINSTNDCKSCDINCRTCQQTSKFCTSCAQFWYLDSTVNQCFQCDQSCYSCDGQQYNQCMSCGENKQLTSDNQCVCKIGYYKDDINCLQCDKSCQDCVNPTQCLNCPFDRYLDMNTKLCICFDGYYEPQDQGCQLCNSQCQTCQDWNNCLTCVTGKTVLDGRCICAQGYYKYGQECLPCNDGKGLFYIECKIINCSDGIWSPYEECDDGNQIANDGCTNCLIDTNYKCINRMRQKSLCYKCQENCQDCAYDKQKINCLQCKDGYFLSQNNCVKCSQLCQTCEQMSTKCLTCLIKDQYPNQNQSCQGCEQGYYFDQNECKSFCGDGLQTISEQCDDGNQISGDGCSQYCTKEDNYQCNSFNGLSICSRLIKPYLYVNQFQKISNSQYLIQIQSSEHVQYEILELQMKSDQKTDQKKVQEIFNYFPIYKNKSEDYISLQFNITVEFNTSVTETYLTLQIDGDIHNIFNLQLESNILQFQFQNILVLSESQNMSSSRISNQASSQMIATLIINCFSLLLSGSDQLALMLRANNILFYIKFIDINIAPNLMQLLLSLEEFNVIDKMNIITTFNNFNVGPKIEFEYIDPGATFSKYNVNANFINNIMPLILNILSGYLFVLLLQVQLYFIGKILRSRQKKINMYNQLYFKILSFYQVYAQKLIIQFKSKGVEQLLEASQYKIVFSICLQMKVSKFTEINSIYYFIITLIFSMNYLKFTYKKLKQQDINLRFKGLRLFNIVNNFNPFIYILCIVFVDQFTLCELVFIQLLSVSMIGALIKFPYKKMQFNIQTIVEEMCLLLLFSSFLLCIYNPQQIDQILLGFIQSGFIIVMLASNIFIQLYSNFLYIQQIYASYQIKTERQKSRLIKNIHSI